MNTTRLLQRISKYCRDHSGGQSQTGESAFCLSSGVHIGVLKSMRNGGEPRQFTLDRMDKFLREKGY
jgi:hypothetical protein